MPTYIMIEKVIFTRILKTDQLVNIKFKESSLPDLPNNWINVGDVPVYANGDLKQVLYIGNGVLPGLSYTVRGSLVGGSSQKDKVFQVIETTVPATTTVPPTTVAPTTVPPTTVPPTTVPPTTVPPTTVPPTTVPPTTVAPTTVAPTTVPPTTAAPITISLGEPICRTGGCNDNATCTIQFVVTTTNAPVGSYIDVIKTSGDGSVSVINSDPNAGVISRTELTGTDLATFFTLQLKNSGGIVIATFDTSVSHQSFWQFLPLCTPATTTAAATTTTPPVQFKYSTASAEDACENGSTIVYPVLVGGDESLCGATTIESPTLALELAGAVIFISHLGNVREAVVSDPNTTGLATFVGACSVCGTPTTTAPATTTVAPTTTAPATTTVAEPTANIALLKTDDNTIIYQNDNIDAFMSYLNSYTAPYPVTVQFNSNTVHQPATGLITISTGLNNGTNLVRFKNKNGFTPVIDGQLVANKVLQINQSNIEWDGINIINALTSDSDTGGSIISLGGNQSNISIKNCLLKRGYVGIRGTTKINGILIDNVVIEEVNYGSVRLGGGAFTPSTKWEDFDARVSADYDLYNVSVKNVTVKDTLAGGNVPGTTGKFKPIILIKQAQGCSIQNISADGDGTVIAVEGSVNLNIDKVRVPICRAGYGITVVATDVVTISNCFVRPIAGSGITYVYLDIIRNLKLLHNSFIYSNSSDGIQISNARRVLKVVGNLFVNGYNAALSISFPAAVNGATYTRSLAQDFQEEHDNVFVSEEGGYDHILALYGVENGSDILVRKSNTWSGAILDVDYRINYPGYGVNSKFQDTDIITLTTRTNPDTSTSEVVYLGSADSVNVGRNMISASLADEAAYDAGGFERLYPTDAGAYDRDATTAAGVSVTISLGSPLCRLNNCNDNASCTVRYNVVTTNAPAGSYIDVVKTSGDGTVSVVNSNPASAVIARNESTGTATATFFTLQLKNSGGVVIASYNTSIGHQSFWQYLPLCS